LGQPFFYNDYHADEDEDFGDVDEDNFVDDDVFDDYWVDADDYDEVVVVDDYFIIIIFEL
jgi:hypothetical protein